MPKTFSELTGSYKSVFRGLKKNRLDAESVTSLVLTRLPSHPSTYKHYPLPELANLTELHIVYRWDDPESHYYKDERLIERFADRRLRAVTLPMTGLSSLKKHRNTIKHLVVSIPPNRADRRYYRAWRGLRKFSALETLKFVVLGNMVTNYGFFYRDADIYSEDSDDEDNDSGYSEEFDDLFKDEIVRVNSQ
jgi:hypothetical protein